MVLYQLTRPIAYLFISDRPKWKIDWALPLLVTTVFVSGFYILPVPKPLFGENGIVKELQGFLQILPGFYLAALAAIATFNKSDLDFYLPKPTPKIDIRVNGKEVNIDLTRRRMLSYLFGYLTFLSLLLYLLTVLGSAVAPSAHIIGGAYYAFVKAACWMLFNLFFWQMIIVTIFGLYQLCDRIHQPEPPTEQ